MESKVQKHDKEVQTECMEVAVIPENNLEEQ